VAVFPGTLEKLFGIDYDFNETWGVSRGTYEALTLGTLAVVLAIALIGYALGRSVREKVAVIPLEGDLPAPAAIT
jgi:glutamate:GABA antiporter